MKKVLLMAFLCICVFVLFGCSSSTPVTPTEAPTEAPTATPTAAPTEAPTPEPSQEELLEANSWKDYTYSRDVYIENGRKAADAMISFAKKNFKNPRSLRLEEAYFAPNWFIFNVSGENSYGGRVRSYYVYYFDEQTLSNLEDMFLQSYLTMSTEAKGDEFNWLASLIDQ